MYKYQMKMNFNTDGDFSWFLAPPGFDYDGCENYSFERYFYSKEELQRWIERYVPALQENVSGKDWVIKKVIDILDHMRKSFYEEENIDFREYISGNYDGTYVSLSGHDQGMVWDIIIPDDLSKKMVACGFDYKDIVDALNLAVEKKRETIKNTLDNE